MIRPMSLDAAFYVLTRLRKDDRDELEATTWRGRAVPGLLQATMAALPFAWCAYHQDRPAAIVGASAVRPGVWQMFAFGTDDFGRVIMALTHHARRIIIPSLADVGAHRLEAYTFASYVKAQRWLEMLGATCEATLKKYGRDRQDFLLYTLDVDQWEHRKITAERLPGSSKTN